MKMTDKKRLEKIKKERKKWDEQYARRQQKHAEKIKKLELKMFLNPTDSNITKFVEFNNEFKQYVIIGIRDGNIVDVISTSDSAIADCMFVKMNDKADDHYKVEYKTSDSNTWKRILKGYNEIR